MIARVEEFEESDVRLSAGDLRLLDLPEAQPIIARLGAATDEGYPDRLSHVLRVACCVVRAKRHPTNSFARATL